MTDQVDTEEVEYSTRVGLLENLPKSIPSDHKQRVRSPVKSLAGETVQRRTSCRVADERATGTSSEWPRHGMRRWMEKPSNRQVMTCAKVQKFQSALRNNRSRGSRFTDGLKMSRCESITTGQSRNSYNCNSCHCWSGGRKQIFERRKQNNYFKPVGGLSNGTDHCHTSSHRVSQMGLQI